MQPQSYPAITAQRHAGRAKITNKPLLRWNGNTAAGKRVRDIYQSLAVQIGSPSDPYQQTAILTAAELIVATEEQRRRAALGEPVDLNALVRVSNLADRAVRKLGIRPAPPLTRFAP
jgi:hypothetical protein